MYVIIGTINGKTISRTFDYVLEAMESRDDLDAHYIPITFIKR